MTPQRKEFCAAVGSIAAINVGTIRRGTAKERASATIYCIEANLGAPDVSVGTVSG
jgi:hypothetical protein